MYLKFPLIHDSLASYDALALMHVPQIPITINIYTFAFMSIYFCLIYLLIFFFEKSTPKQTNFNNKTNH